MRHPSSARGTARPGIPGWAPGDRPRWESALKQRGCGASGWGEGRACPGRVLAGAPHSHLLKWKRWCTRKLSVNSRPENRKR